MANKSEEENILKSKLKKQSDFSYTLEKDEKMNVPGLLFLNDSLFQAVDDRVIQQVKNVAECLPGIQGASIAMSDMHIGYGFTIGGVAAMDAKEGCISPGGIGFDINCGVRVLTTNIKVDQVRPKIKELMQAIYDKVPAGVGCKSDLRLSDAQLVDVLVRGVDWCIEHDIGTEADKENCEENGCMTSADPDKVPMRAKARGKNQLGTLGAGNHFVEIQCVDKIFNDETAKTFGLTEPGQVVIMIHCGSRGLGHQVCSDYIRMMEEEDPERSANLPDKDLIFAPLSSPIADDYFKAMSAAANFAWANRHTIAHRVRTSFKDLFGEDTEVDTLYDVAHNIAKLETHKVGGKEKQVYVHRKGATRAFGPGSKDIPEKYQKTGQPVLIPGSMGTASYILAGTKGAMEKTFGSSAHGAGRAMGRHAAIQKFKDQNISEKLLKQGIYVKCDSWKGVCEEAPEAYKNVDDVVKVAEDAGISKIIARLKPVGVLKG